MKNKAFETIIELLNGLIAILNAKGLNLYDAENPDFFISKIRHDSEDDCLKFDTLQK